MIREAFCAGLFYPAESDRLQSMIVQFIDKADISDIPSKALIAPHAGYTYSGPIAGFAYASIRHKARRIQRIILLGPTHRFAFRGIAVPSCTTMRTPLGEVPVNLAAVKTCIETQKVHYLDHVFDHEHSLEVHLPFIQHTFDNITIVPLLTGDVSTEDVGLVLSKVWGGEETLIIVSSDLSHYFDYHTAHSLDTKTSQSIERLQAIPLESACGFRAICGLLQTARQKDLRATTQDLRNSGDISGKHDRVVGYGAWTFEESQHAQLSSKQRSILLNVARRTLKQGKKVISKQDKTSIPLPLRSMRRIFVTLKADGVLRGCIGSITNTGTLVEEVAEMTEKSMHDPRFTPVSAEEGEKITISISILSHPRPLRFDNEPDLCRQIRPHVDGLILSTTDKKGIFLPSVWENFPDPRVFVQNLKRKAGFDEKIALQKNVQAFHFTTENFSE